MTTETANGEFKRLLENIVAESSFQKAIHSTFMGEHDFTAYELGQDTIIIEDILRQEDMGNIPLVFIDKKAIGLGDSGYVVGISTGNHSTVSIPLLASMGEFKDYFPIDLKDDSNDIMTYNMLRANHYPELSITGETRRNIILLSQREVESEILIRADEWLNCMGYPEERILLSDRVGQKALDTKHYYEAQGKAWKLMPLAWELKDKEAELRNRKRTIATKNQYYHNVKGVHFLSYQEFESILESFDNREEFIARIEEVNAELHSAEIKYEDHHEVELFGVEPDMIEDMRKGVSKLLDDIQKKPGYTREFFTSFLVSFWDSLKSEDMGIESSEEFTHEMYRHVTGQSYTESSDFSTFFDEKRKPLKGALYSNKKRMGFHPETDDLTRSIIEHIETINQDYQVEYANVYEIQSDKHEKGHTLEVVYKLVTESSERDLVIKKLSKPGSEYTNYAIARASVLHDLGLPFGKHELVKTDDSEFQYLARDKYPGIGFDRLPKKQYGKGLAYAIVEFMGEAAATNYISKTYLPDQNSCCYAKGKEIIEEGFQDEEFLPLNVRYSTIRGTFGWWENHDKEDIEETYESYSRSYADFLNELFIEFVPRNEDNLEMQRFLAKKIPGWKEASSMEDDIEDLKDMFITSFTRKYDEVLENYRQNKQKFDNFDPGCCGDYNFHEKWKNTLWSLEHTDVNRLTGLIMDKLA